MSEFFKLNLELDRIDYTKFTLIKEKLEKSLGPISDEYVIHKLLTEYHKVEELENPTKVLLRGYIEDLPSVRSRLYNLGISFEVDNTLLHIFVEVDYDTALALLKYLKNNKSIHANISAEIITTAFQYKNPVKGNNGERR